MRIHRIRDAVLLLTVVLYTAGLATPGLVALLIVLVGELFLRSWRWISTPLDLPLLALVLAILASTAVSEWRVFTVDLVAYFLLAVLVSVHSVAAYACGGADRVMRLLAFWVAGGAAAAAWGLVRSWPVGFTLASTPVINQNTFGTTLAVAAVLTLALLLGGAVRRPWMWALGLVVIVAGLASTMARAAWVGSAAGVVTLMLVGAPPRVRAALALACAVLIGIGWMIPPQRSALNDKLQSIRSLEVNRNRLLMWGVVPKIVADYPILGSGYGTFPHVFPRYRPPEVWERHPPFAHNILLNFAAETGILGLAAFVSVCSAGFVSTWRWLARSPPASPGRAAATAVLAALVTFLTNQLFDGTALTVHAGFGLLALFALGAAGERSLRRA